MSGTDDNKRTVEMFAEKFLFCPAKFYSSQEMSSEIRRNGAVF